MEVVKKLGISKDEAKMLERTSSGRDRFLAFYTDESLSIYPQRKKF